MESVPRIFWPQPCAQVGTPAIIIGWANHNDTVCAAGVFPVDTYNQSTLATALERLASEPVYAPLRATCGGPPMVVGAWNATPSTFIPGIAAWRERSPLWVQLEASAGESDSSSVVSVAAAPHPTLSTTRTIIPRVVSFDRRGTGSAMNEIGAPSATAASATAAVLLVMYTPPDTARLEAYAARLTRAPEIHALGATAVARVGAVAPSDALKALTAQHRVRVGVGITSPVEGAAGPAAASIGSPPAPTTRGSDSARQRQSLPATANSSSSSSRPKTATKGQWEMVLSQLNAALFVQRVLENQRETAAKAGKASAVPAAPAAPALWRRCLRWAVFPWLVGALIARTVAVVGLALLEARWPRGATLVAVPRRWLVAVPRRWLVAVPRRWLVGCGCARPLPLAGAAAVPATASTATANGPSASGKAPLSNPAPTATATSTTQPQGPAEGVPVVDAASYVRLRVPAQPLPLLPLYEASSLARQVHVKLSAICTWPHAARLAQRLRSDVASGAAWHPPDALYAARCALADATLRWAVDEALGIAAALLLATSYWTGGWAVAAVLRRVHSVGAILHIDVLRAWVDWLAVLPAGLKLNAAAGRRLGSAVLAVIDLWEYGTTLLTPWEPAIVAAVGAAGLGGATLLLACAADVLDAATAHIRLLYTAFAALHNAQVALLASLWQLFRGKKVNILRGRVDSADYDTASLLLGTLAFAAIFFLAPTVVVYYAFFTAVWLGVLAARAGLWWLLTLLNNAPFFAASCLLAGSTKASTLLPSGVYISLICAEVKTSGARADSGKAGSTVVPPKLSSTSPTKPKRRGEHSKDSEGISSEGVSPAEAVVMTCFCLHPTVPSWGLLLAPFSEAASILARRYSFGVIARSIIFGERGVALFKTRSEHHGGGSHHEFTFAGWRDYWQALVEVADVACYGSADNAHFD